MTKRQSQYRDLVRACRRLEEAVELEETEIHRDATIQRFEFTFELSWKLMQSILQYLGVETYGPRNIIREAAKAKLLDDPERWFEFLRHRNLATHTYNEGIARQVYKAAGAFTAYCQDLLERAKDYTNDE